ncbi:MAG: MG2 domain-containing protein [Spirochaetes bacterium]|nr:MG2 domain-containing protein [Spirochaetota bacterium]
MFNNKKYWITQFVLFVLFLVSGFFIGKENYSNGLRLLTRVMLPVLGMGYIIPFILTGIPALIRKALKKKSNFADSMLFGSLLVLILVSFIARSKLNSSLVGLISILFALFMILHSIFMNSTGFFFHKIIIWILEKLFNIKILSMDQFKNLQSPEEIKNLSEPESKKINLPPFVHQLLKLKSAVFYFLKKHWKPFIAAVGILLILTACVTVGMPVAKKMINQNTATIKSISPEGLTSSNIIEIIYNDDIEFINPEQPGEVLSISPPLKGIYKIEGRTLQFIPDEKFPDSTQFQVKINGTLLQSPNKNRVESRKFEFHTTMFAVTSSNFYYIMDEVSGQPSELVGEIVFSLDVDFNTLSERIAVSVDKKTDLPTQIESSNRRNVIYLNIKGFEQKLDDQVIKLTIKNGVMPLSGTLGLVKDYIKTVALKGKEKLKVESLKTYPVVGNTYISLQFNIPVVENQVANHISIEPSIPFEVEAEYRYVVLKANFLPNTEYQIKVKKEMPAQSGTGMKEDYENSVRIRDLKPYAKFVAEGKILPATDNLNVEFVTLNLDKARFSVEKVYRNNLVYYLTQSGGYYDDDYGQYNGNRKHLYSKSLEITEGNINEEVKHLLNLKNLTNTKYEGLYYLTLADPRSYNNDHMFIHITNLGLIVKNDGKDLNIYAVNILTLEPVSGVTVSLVSRENQLLQSGLSDSNGRVIFSRYKNTAERLNPFLITAEKGNDFTYIRLNENQLDYSTFSVGGTTANRYYDDAFVTVERGVYRPGEEIYSTIIVRKNNLTVPKSVPLSIIMQDPTGKQVFQSNVMTDDEGLVSITIPTETHYKTGEYRLRVYQEVDHLIGSTGLKIEEFIPHTIQANIKILAKDNRSVKFKVAGNELHGAPAIGLKVKCWAILKSLRFTHKDFRDFQFYDENKSSFYQQTIELGSVKLDNQGEAVYELQVPANVLPPSALQTVLYAEVFDSAGRPVSAAITLDMHKYLTYFGVKITGQKPFQVNKPVKIGYVALDPEGNPVTEENVTITIKRKVWYSIFKKYSWRESYSSEYYEEVLYKKTITIDQLDELDFTPDKGGRYTIIIGKENEMFTTTSFYINDRKQEAYRDMEDPYKLIMTLDKKAYAPGETAYLTILSPFEGKVLITIERDKIYSSHLLNLQGKKATFSIPVTNDFVPNMYVSAVAYRKPTYEFMPLPPVSYGTLNISMDKTKLSQDIEINTPELVRSSDGININLKLTNGAGSKVVIAAVDEGILAITNYQRPDPYDYFYRKRRLNVKTQTTLKDLLPDIVPYKKAFGGGYDSALERRHLNPIEAKRVKSLALYSGILECDAKGEVSHFFKLPQFNGRVRVMVMAVKGNNFGSTQSQVTVSDPIVLGPGIPRFMSPGDQVLLPLRIFNKTGQPGEFTIDLKTDGPIDIVGNHQQTIEVNNENLGKTQFLVKGAQDAGVAHIKFKATGNNEETFHETELAVRPATPLDTKVIHGVLKPEKETTISLPQGYIEQGKFHQLVISSNRMVEFLGGLEYLIRYPYGCTEQTVSAAFPLLYLKELAQYSSLFSENPYLIDKYIDIAIKKVTSRQRSNGGFSFWDGADYEYPWISDYVSHFLIEAKRLGYPVKDSVYQAITKRLGLAYVKQGRLDRRANYQNQKHPYALFVGSIIGQADNDRLQYYYDILLDKDKVDQLTESDRCFLAAAYAVQGKKSRAKEFLPSHFKIKTMIRKFKDTLDSYARNTALYLYAMSYIDPQDKIVTYLEEELMKQLTQTGHFGNTHDTAWSLMALSRIYETKKDRFKGELLVNEQIIKTMEQLTVLNTKDLAGKNYTIRNTGNVDIYYHVYSFGYPLKPNLTAENKGIEVNKKITDIKGKEIDVKNLKQGEQYVITLTAKNQTEKALENMVMMDLLPAGFEIENWRLASRGEYQNIPANNIYMTYSDIRDDRILIFADRFYKELRFSYVVRAVSPGTFNLPQFFMEAMYDPQIYGKTSGEDPIVIKETEE